MSCTHTWIFFWCVYLVGDVGSQRCFWLLGGGQHRQLVKHWAVFCEMSTWRRSRKVTSGESVCRFEGASQQVASARSRGCWDAVPTSCGRKKARCRRREEVAEIVGVCRSVMFECMKTREVLTRSTMFLVSGIKGPTRSPLALVYRR